MKMINHFSFGIYPPHFNYVLFFVDLQIEPMYEHDTTLFKHLYIIYSILNLIYHVRAYTDLVNISKILDRTHIFMLMLVVVTLLLISYDQSYII